MRGVASIYDFSPIVLRFEYSMSPVQEVATDIAGAKTDLIVLMMCQEVNYCI